MKVLANILKTTKMDLSQKKKFGNFSKNILNPKKGKIALIAEIKLASPTEKNLGDKKDILKISKKYENINADSISFITEKSIFKGDIKYVPEIKSAVALPVLQKDFIIDPYQIYEAKMAGSDALLLIAKILDAKTLIGFVDLCLKIGIEPVVEINDKKDLEKGLKTKTKIIAVNARNLDTLKVDLEKAYQILSLIPDKFIKLGFSGISSKKEVDEYKKAGAKGVLIGTNLMKAKDVNKFLGNLR